MQRTNCKSIKVFVWTENGKFIGEWPSITYAAKANDTTSSSVTNALYMYKDRFSVGKFWLKEGENIEDFIAIHKEVVNRKKQESLKKKPKEKKPKQIFEKTERRGNYIFIKSDRPGNECCMHCALYYTKCLPCRKDEGHENGYWRYSRNLEN